MRWNDIQRNPSTKTLRQFAVLWLLFFGGLAAYSWKQNNSTTLVIFVSVSTLAIPGFIFPAILKPIFVGWMILAFPIGWILSHVILIAVFYGVFTPVGFILKMLGHDPLCRKKPVTDSYWLDKSQVTDLRRYFKQF